MKNYLKSYNWFADVPALLIIASILYFSFNKPPHHNIENLNENIWFYLTLAYFFIASVLIIFRKKLGYGMTCIPLFGFAIKTVVFDMLLSFDLNPITQGGAAASVVLWFLWGDFYRRRSGMIHPFKMIDLIFKK